MGTKPGGLRAARNLLHIRGKTVYSSRMNAGTLKCPNCGAAAASDATRCPYCNAALETVACPHCMGMMFVGTKFCPHCGVQATQLVEGAKTANSCPRCHIALEEIKLGAMAVDQCGHCGGLWMNNATFDRVCSDAEAQSAAMGLNLPPPAEIDPHVHYLACPQCHSLMGRVNYFERSGIVTNVCRPHGVWLDRDQLRQIVEFIRSGGLDRARRVEKEELETARRALENQQRLPDIDLRLEDDRL